ncbi:MAG: helix-turn-helix transcriptional regulator [Phycisphaerales bacterium]|nr:MAG: helix-turn-helix transcriptional regulator [Phycisphaerales bacterium]
MGSAFGQRLRELRRQAGLSQRRLAKEVGVDFSYVSKLENDRLPAPSAETVIRLAEAIGASTEELLAVAKKIPGAVGDEVVGEPAAQRFLRMASTMKLSGPEWEAMVGKLESLREKEPSGGDEP